MNDLIQIEQRNGKETVKAYDLYTFLEVGRDFSTWLKDRIEKYGFQEASDYTSVFRSPIPGSGNRGAGTDYFLSLDMAKELSMVENNSKGREARQYFIEVEKKAREIYSGPMLLARAVLEAAAMIEQKDQLILEMKPKADYFDAVAGSKTAVHMGVVAKTLDFQGAGRNILFQILREHGVLQENTQPYQKFIDSGDFRLVQNKFTNAKTGSLQISFTALVYQKGMKKIRDLLIKEGYKPRTVSV